MRYRYATQKGAVRKPPHATWGTTKKDALANAKKAAEEHGKPMSVWRRAEYSDPWELFTIIHKKCPVCKGIQLKRCPTCEQDWKCLNPECGECGTCSYRAAHGLDPITGKKPTPPSHQDLAFRFLAAGAQCARDAAKEIKHLDLQWGDDMRKELEDVAQQLDEFHVRIEEDA
jgi:hypothetical protein